MAKKEMVVFTKRINPAQTVTLKEMVKSAGNLTHLTVRFYSGQQRALQVLPFVQHKGNKPESLITFSEGGDVSSDTFLAGDDDRIEVDISVPVQYDDLLCVRVTNTDAVNPYDVVVYITVEYSKEG